MCTYWASRPRPRLAYYVEALRLIAKSDAELPSDFEIIAAGRRVERLTKVYVCWWNAGNTAIRGGDIVESDRLRLMFEEGAHILSARVFAPRLVNGFSVSAGQTGHEVACSFDYLDPKDGVIVEIVHSGNDPYPTVAGTVRGIRAGLTDCGTAELRSRRGVWAASLGLFGAALGLLIAYTWWSGSAAELRRAGERLVCDLCPAYQVAAVIFVLVVGAAGWLAPFFFAKGPPREFEIAAMRKIGIFGQQRFVSSELPRKRAMRPGKTGGKQ